MTSLGQDTPKVTRMSRAARRQQLLDAARSVFVEHGYHSTGMDEIADRAGVSKPVLYQHFPGKLDLYLALLDQANDALLSAVVGSLSATQDNRERVAATVLAYYRFVAADDSAYRLIFESDVRGDDEVASRAAVAADRTADAIAAVLADQTGMGAGETALLASAVVGMAQTSARAWLTDPQGLELEQAAHLVARLIWRGIGNFPRMDTEGAVPTSGWVASGSLASGSVTS